MLLQGAADGQRFAAPGGFVPYAPYYGYPPCGCASGYCVGRYQQHHTVKHSKPSVRRRMEVASQHQPFPMQPAYPPMWHGCSHAVHRPPPPNAALQQIHAEGQILPHFFELAADVIMTGRQDGPCTVVHDWRCVKCPCSSSGGGCGVACHPMDQPAQLHALHPQKLPPLPLVFGHHPAAIATTLAMAVGPVTNATASSSSSSAASSSCWTAAKPPYPTCPYIPEANARQDSYLQELSQLRWAMKSDVSMQAKPEEQFRIVIDEHAISPVSWLEIDDSLAWSEPDSPPVLESQEADEEEDFLEKLRPSLCDADWLHNVGPAGDCAI